MTLLVQHGISPLQVAISEVFGSLLKYVRQKNHMGAGEFLLFLRFLHFSDFLSALAVQRKIESHIRSDAGLFQLAKDSLSAYKRAYATHSRMTKYIFHLRNLHPIHLANSFGLTETFEESRRTQKQVDKSLEKNVKKARAKQTRKQEEKGGFRAMLLSEFDSGL